MSLSDYLVSVIRTVVPVVVGFVVAKLALAGVTIDSAALQLVLDGTFISGYYALVRALEARWPAFGVLLGWIARPTYTKNGAA